MISFCFWAKSSRIGLISLINFALSSGTNVSKASILAIICSLWFPLVSASSAAKCSSILLIVGSIALLLLTIVVN